MISEIFDCFAQFFKMLRAKTEHQSEGEIIKTASDAFKETTKQNTEFSDKVIGLSKDLKNAEYIRPELPKHKHEKFKIVKFYRLRGKNANYLIAENNKGNKYFYKVADPEVIGSKTLASKPANNIIPNKNNNFNPKKAIISALSNESVQEGIKETLNKLSQINAYHNMEKKYGIKFSRHFRFN